MSPVPRGIAALRSWRGDSGASGWRPAPVPGWRDAARPGFGGWECIVSTLSLLILRKRIPPSGVRWLSDLRAHWNDPAGLWNQNLFGVLSESFKGISKVTLVGRDLHLSRSCQKLTHMQIDAPPAQGIRGTAECEVSPRSALLGHTRPPTPGLPILRFLLPPASNAEEGEKKKSKAKSSGILMPLDSGDSFSFHTLHK